MDQERTSSILFLVFFLLLLIPFPLCSLHGNDSSALICNLSLHFSALCMENVTLLGDPSFMNKSLSLSTGATTVVFILLVPFQEMKTKSSVSISKEFFFSVQGSNGPALFLSSQELLLDVQVLLVELELLITAKDLLEYKSGRSRCLTIWLLQPRKWIKKPVLSAKCNLGNQFLSFPYADFSASKKVGNASNQEIKCRSLKTFGSDSSLPEKYEKKDIVLGVYKPVLALISIISAVFSYLKKLFTKRKENPQIPSSETPASSQDSFYSFLFVGFRRFTYSELSAATKDFHQSEILGIGRYASVYRATFPESDTMYAVKRFNQNPSSKLSFEIEATAISRLQHDKILELRGWCDENLNELLLVYDYMPNRSLEEALWNRKQPLLWPQRYKIAVGVAEALVYIHEECSPSVIHGDVKDGNVMLDADFNPKLGDFGLAISGPPYQLWRERTEQDPPECELNAFVTEKLDVYLYGSMVLRLCCQLGTQRLTIFSQLLRHLKLEGKLLNVVDKKLGGNYNEEEILRLLNVGLLCLEEEMQKRPSMKQVLQILTSEGDTEQLII